MPCAWLPPGVTPLLGRTYPKGVSGRQGHFTRQVALYWRYFYGLEATFLFSLLMFPGYPGAFPRRRPLHGLSYPRVSGSSAVVTLPLSHSILATPSWAAPYPDDVLLGDALPWRRFLLARSVFGVTST